MRDLPNLELHEVHACNLACESCSHYSDHGHRGMLTPADAASWMAPWSGRLRPRLFSLLGGEPTIHRQLGGFILLARRHWPSSPIRLATNGFFLDRHPDLPRILRDAAPSRIDISFHHDSPDYRAKTAPVRRLAEDWRARYGIDIRIIEAHRDWTRRYHGHGGAMQPFADGRPRQSWEICPARWCPQLHDGKIWKCAPLAYLPLQNERYTLSAAWSHSLSYRPLEPGCGDVELNAFFDREEESYCAACPAERRPFDLPDPLRRPLSPAASAAGS